MCKQLLFSFQFISRELILAFVSAMLFEAQITFIGFATRDRKKAWTIDTLPTKLLGGKMPR